MKIKAGEVIPGVSIGEYKIGMRKEELLQIIGADIKERYINSDESIITLENAVVWIDRNKTVRKIGVSKGFQGLYNASIGIGSTLQEVNEIFGKYEYDQYTYIISGIDGMCFELEDVEGWEEETAPIEWIYIYRVES